MRIYEAMLIIRPDLDSQIYDQIRQKVSSVLTEEKGELKDWSVWKEKHRFAYSLRSRGAEKKEYTEGTYILIEFLAKPKGKDVLKYRLDLDDNILRHLITVKKTK